ncbi:hypothetical protein JL720_11388 [Aureococcus anophagefferens]|nr:hypothetical protein JL720_11388 [Aureococcus anophagefferens]
MLRLAALALAVARTYCAPDAAKVAEVETAIAATRSKLLAIYGEGVEAALLRQGVEFLDDEHGRGKVSYPNVCNDVLRDVFGTAGINFHVRNMAMGGVPSFPNSVCMEDNFGRDADVVVWDFRMVERDEIKGELYAYNQLNKAKSPGVANDKFCEGACECPGQVRWHAGWKMQRFRGVHMALAYLDLFEAAVDHYKQLLAAGSVPPSDHARWALQPRDREALHAPLVKECKDPFCSATFNCAMTWQPKVGRSLVDLVDPQLGLNGWKMQHPSPRVADITNQGQTKCHYKDEKRSLVGNAKSHWVFFNVPNVQDGGLIGFCGDFQSQKFDEYALIVVNQEEVDKLTIWLESSHSVSSITNGGGVTVDIGSVAAAGAAGTGGK